MAFKNYFLFLFCFILLGCNSNNNTEEVKDLYNLNIARELEICFDKQKPFPEDPKVFYPLCSDSTVRVFFLEPNYYLSYISSGGWCGSCGCHLTLYKKERDKYIEIGGWPCCNLDLTQPIADYIIIKDGKKNDYCWPGYEAKIKVKHDEFYIEEIISYHHKIVNDDEHSDSCEYQDSLWVFQ